MKTLRIKPLSIAVLLLSTGLLSGCLFEGEQSLEKMDAPKETVTSNPESNSEDVAKQQAEEPEPAKDEMKTETVARELYLIDSNGMVAPQTVELPKSEEPATQALEHLVKDGPITNSLPNGFQAVLPAGTEILGLNIEADGTLVVDVSKEFKEYKPQNEQKILQAMTYTLTQFDSVDRIKLWINGHEQEVMPVNGTPISGGVSRSDGININVGDKSDIINSEAVTVYFPAQNNEQIYHVPVTTRVSKGEDLYSSVVQALLNGPEIGSSLSQPFNEGAEVRGTALKDGVLTLSFNEAILTGQEQKALDDQALSSLVMSLTEMKDVEAVELQVEGVEHVLNEAGEPLTEPVSRTDLSEPESL